MKALPDADFNRYPNLNEVDIDRVNKAFEKIFKPKFGENKIYLAEKVLPSAGTHFIQT